MAKNKEGKIVSLTKKQEVLLRQYYDDWFAIGSSTESADFKSAEEAIAILYEKIGKPMPSFVFHGTQASCLIAIGLLSSKQEKENEPIIDALVKNSGPGSIWYDHQSLKEFIKEKGLNVDQGKISDGMNQYLYGSFDSPWISYYLFCEEIGVKYQEEHANLLRVWEKLAKSCSWWWPFTKAIFIADRPEFIGWDDEERPRIHCDNGPAVRLRCGYSLWAINGVVVPEKVVMAPKDQTLGEINGEENLEIRRIRIERFGWDSYLLKSNATVLDSDVDIDGIARSLMKVGGYHVLVAACTSTGRTYTMEVPEECDTIEKADRYLQGDRPGNVVIQS